MIELLPLNATLTIQFENYPELFDYLMTIENLKPLVKHSNFRYRNWSFTVYSPQQVTILYAYRAFPSPALKKAFEENLPLIEICAGDYESPLYVVVTPNVDMDSIKKNWCIDYCAFHHLLVREF